MRKTLALSVVILLSLFSMALPQGGPNAVMGGSTSQIAKQRKTAYSLATTSGTVAAGAKKVIFIFSADFVGTIKGASQGGAAVAFTGASDASFSPPCPDTDTLEAQVYTIAAGNIRIIVTR